MQLNQHTLVSCLRPPASQEKQAPSPTTSSFLPGSLPPTVQDSDSAPPPPPTEASHASPRTALPFLERQEQQMTLLTGVMSDACLQCVFCQKHHASSLQPQPSPAHHITARQQMTRQQITLQQHQLLPVATRHKARWRLVGTVSTRPEQSCPKSLTCCAGQACS